MISNKAIIMNRKTLAAAVIPMLAACQMLSIEEVTKLDDIGEIYRAGDVTDAFELNFKRNRSKVHPYKNIWE